MDLVQIKSSTCVNKRQFHSSKCWNMLAANATNAAVAIAPHNSFPFFASSLLESSTLAGIFMPYLWVVFRYIEVTFEIIVSMFISTQGTYQKNHGSFSRPLALTNSVTSIWLDSFKSFNGSHESEPLVHATLNFHPLVAFSHLRLSLGVITCLSVTSTVESCFACYVIASNMVTKKPSESVLHSTILCCNIGWALFSLAIRKFNLTQ